MNQLKQLKPSLLLYVLVGLSVLVVPARGQESERGDRPAPTSVWGMGESRGRQWQHRPSRAARFPRLEERLEYLASFLHDDSLVLKPRTYYLDRKGKDGTRVRAWALGGSLGYRSGWWRDFLSIGAELYDSEKLQGEHDEGGTGLLQPIQEGYTILGRAYVTLRRGQQRAVLYRQSLDLPYVNKNDSRMTPNTFEAYTLSGTVEPGRYLQRIKYVAGYVDKVRLRFADQFIDMASAAGVNGANRGLATAGARLQLTDQYAIGGVNHYVKDVINIAYAGTDYTYALTDEVGIRLESQFTHQSSVGDDLLTGEDFKTWNLGARAATSYRNLILKTAFSTTGSGDRIRSPYGSYPGYLSLMQRDFDRAGEDAWLVGASYNFKNWGLDGLSTFLNYAQGSTSREAEGVFTGGLREFDVTADYRIEEGAARGLWFRVRWSTLDIEGEEDQSTDFRVVVNYELPIF